MPSQDNSGSKVFSCPLPVIAGRSFAVSHLLAGCGLMPVTFASFFIVGALLICFELMVFVGCRSLMVSRTLFAFCDLPLCVLIAVCRCPPAARHTCFAECGMSSHVACCRLIPHLLVELDHCCLSLPVCPLLCMSLIIHMAVNAWRGGVRALFGN